MPIKDASPQVERPEMPSASTTLQSLEGIVVLVIDDQEQTRDVVAAMLQQTGATIHTAGSVREGIQRFREVKPDVVVCDIAMPEEDGYVFVRDVRSRKDPTPILALTAFGRPEDRTLALQAGFDAYLKKPVDPSELARTVKQLAIG
jgi:CheY-like chemotaxis protein